MKAEIQACILFQPSADPNEESVPLANTDSKSLLQNELPLFLPLTISCFSSKDQCKARHGGTHL
jgi:hypothetical protein